MAPACARLACHSRCVENHKLAVKGYGDRANSDDDNVIVVVFEEVADPNRKVPPNYKIAAGFLLVMLIAGAIVWYANRNGRERPNENDCQ